MTTASTTLLGLALPVTGELSGTWGDVVNASLTNLLDTAIAGTTTLSSDADVTLTTTTLSANQARQAVILWTAGGTATRTITAPAQSKPYIVINKTSSSQSIKIVGVGPTTGVTIVAGTAALVVWNGVDFVTVSVTSTTGIVPVANGGTGLASGTSGGVLAYTATGTLVSSAALAASALVLGGGAGAAPSTTTTGTGVVTALGVNTGSAGAFVVNGGALGSPSSAGTIPAFTLGGTVAGGGNQLNNVIIGTTTPLAGSFTTLSATVPSAAQNVTFEASTVAYGAAVKLKTTVGQLIVGKSRAAGNDFVNGGYGNYGVITTDTTDGVVIGVNSTVVATFTTGGINGVLGATTPAAASVTTLSATGNATIGAASGVKSLTVSSSDNNASVIIAAGNGATGGLRFNNYAGTQHWNIYETEGASGQQGNLSIYNEVAAANQLVLDSSGNLGLGVTPSAWSSTFKGFQLGSTGSIWSISSGNGGTYYGNNYIYGTSGRTYLTTGTALELALASGAFQFNIAASGTAGNPVTFTQAMTLDSSGNLGIGASSPSAKLDVRDVTQVYTGNYGNFSIINSANSNIVLSMGIDTTLGTNGSAYINAAKYGTAYIPLLLQPNSGDVGIGTSSPQVQNWRAGTYLTVANASTRGQIETDAAVADSSSAALGALLFSYSTNTTNHKTVALIEANSEGATANQRGGSLNFFTKANGTASPARNMILDSSGNLLVGTTSGTSYKLALKTSSASQSAIGTTGTSGDTAFQAILITKFDNDSTTSQNFIQFQINNGGANCGKITANGANTAAFGSTSDQRVKENIAELPSQLANIMALRPVEFDYLESYGGGHQIGFIAQEIQQVYPDVISTDDSSEKIMSITGWSKTEARLVKAIQEQQAIITALTTRITALEAK